MKKYFILFIFVCLSINLFAEDQQSERLEGLYIMYTDSGVQFMDFNSNGLCYMLGNRGNGFFGWIDKYYINSDELTFERSTDILKIVDPTTIEFVEGVESFTSYVVTDKHAQLKKVFDKDSVYKSYR